jgi:hypothetical protein
MLRFLGYEIELFAVGVISDADGFGIRYGTDLNGGHWLIVGGEQSTQRQVWVCAPVTVRMLEEVAAGRASAWDAARRSISGMVDVIEIDNGRAVPDRCVRTADLNPDSPWATEGRLTLAA